MKEKIMEIINNSKISLNPTEIMNRIKQNSTVDDLKELLTALDDLVKDGTLRQSSGNTYKINDAIIGIIDVHEKGNAHLIMNNGEDDLFIPKNQINGACDNDKVSVEIINKERNEARVVKILERSLNGGVGEVYNEDGILKIKLKKELPYELVIENNPDVELIDGLLVKLVYVKDLGKKKVLARVDYKIAHKNEPDCDVKCIAEEYKIPYIFTEGAKEEAKNMPHSLSEEMINEGLKEGRTDFRNDIIFTIDGKDTKDIDDAISLTILPNGNYRLGVHIADVSHYVKRNSELWNNAELRGNSNYLGDKVIPMLPIELSNMICSLNEGTDRFTISCVMEIDHAGNVVSSNITKGIIDSRKKMNYDAVQDILEDKETEDTKSYTTLKYIAREGDTLDSIAFANNMTVEDLKEYNKDITVVKGTEVNIPVRKIIKNMDILAKKIRGNKERRGALSFESTEKKYKFNDDNRVIDVLPREQRESEMLIEDFMIIANETIATTFFEKNLPFIYRVHGTPSEKSIENFMKFLSLQGITYNGKITRENVSCKELQDLLSYLKKNLPQSKYVVINRKLLRCMQEAQYNVENIGHFGIASLCYTHFTSPIRRMSDLIVHTLITDFLINRNLEEKYLKEWSAYLATVSERVSDTERVSKDAEYAMDDMLDAEYMEGYDNENRVHIGGHVGEEFDAIIDTCMPHAFFVQTDKYIEGRVDLATLDGFYQYKEDMMAYTKNGKVALRYGDKVRVKCIRASKLNRTIDFALVKKVA